MLTPEDWRIFRQVRLRALADAPDAFGITLAEAELNADSVWRERVQGPGPTMVATEDREPVAMGGAFVPPGSGVAMLWGMWTSPEARGRGHASRILAELLSWCRERDLTVMLDVTEGNAQARNLYLARGFQSTGEWQPLREGSSLRVESMRLDSP